MPLNSRLVRPRSGGMGFNPRTVAKAYNFPMQYTGKGRTCGIIELGGGFTQADVTKYFQDRQMTVPKVDAVLVDGGRNLPEGSGGADSEVLLDIEVAAAIAPDASYRVYFAPNTDSGFLDAIRKAVADKVDVISISWGGPENTWSAASLDRYNTIFQAARQAGVVVFAAAGDNGSGDGESGSNVDFPASSPNVVGCGGTRLVVNSAGSRVKETVWNDSTSSATGGGVSAHFPGRQVPDIAGNADPVTGYDVLVDGDEFVIGGTSAVAPLYAGLVLLLSEALGAPLGARVDFLNTILTNPEVCYDVTVGNNGAFKAGPGRDQTTGFGVVDGSKLLAVLTDAVGDPAPVPPVSPPAPPTPPTTLQADLDLAKVLRAWHPYFYLSVKRAADTWLSKRGL